MTSKDDRLYIWVRATGEVLGRVLTNHNLSIDEAMNYAGFEWYQDDNDSGWTIDNGVTLNNEDSVIVGYKE